MAARLRSSLASLVGWVLAVLLVLWAARFVLGSLFWLLRSLIVIVALLVLFGIYLALKAPDTDE